MFQESVWLNAENKFVWFQGQIAKMETFLYVDVTELPTRNESHSNNLFEFADHWIFPEGVSVEFLFK